MKIDLLKQIKTIKRHFTEQKFVFFLLQNGTLLVLCEGNTFYSSFLFFSFFFSKQVQYNWASLLYDSVFIYLNFAHLIFKRKKQPNQLISFGCIWSTIAAGIVFFLFSFQKWVSVLVCIALVSSCRCWCWCWCRCQSVQLNVILPFILSAPTFYISLSCKFPLFFLQMMELNVSRIHIGISLLFGLIFYSSIQK